MRKFIFNTTIFIGISVVVTSLFGVGSLLDNLDKSSSHNRNIISLQNKSKYDDLDILFVGNSYCYSGIKPSLLDSIGLSSFNLGIATAGVEFYELVIDDYLENTKHKPKIIFILVSPMTFSSSADNYSAYPIHRYLENPKSNIEIMIKYNHLDKFNSMFRKSIRKGFQNIFVRNFDLPSHTIENKGYIYSNKTITFSETKKIDHLYTPLLADEFSDTKVSYLEKLAKALQRQGIEVVYFELPTNKLRDYFSQDYLLAYDSSIARLAINQQLLKIEKSLFTDSNFRNIDHMNDAGAQIATREVINYLKNRNIN